MGYARLRIMPHGHAYVLEVLAMPLRTRKKIRKATKISIGSSGLHQSRSDVPDFELSHAAERILDLPRR